MPQYGPDAIAVVGMAGRFPKAPDIATFWRNLLSAKDCISDFSPAELMRSGVAREVIEARDFVPSWGVLSDADKFDAAFFGYTPKEAVLMDPQHRIVLETVWHALEDAGFDPYRTPNPCGVFLGSSLNFYFLDHVFGNPRALAPGARPYGEDRVPPFTATDYLAARVAFKLNLTGPSQTVRAACASSLVSVVSACQMLADFTCDTAVAGGVSVSGRDARGYFGHFDHGMLSPSGRCRSFDARADGSVFSDAVGCVVLRRLEDALADGCRIHAVLQGWATNNDGADKVGFSAPSVSGQASVIAQALERAEISSTQVGAIEAHGSATPIGDAVEIAALSRVFGRRSSACVIGAVKSSIGHANGASGIAGLIKGILQVREGSLPPVVHFDAPNSELHLDESRFAIAHDAPTPLQPDAPYCGVSSFGLGGMNAHVILAPPPERPQMGPVPTLAQVPLMVSAPTAEALTRQVAAVNEMSDPLRADLACAARGLSVGRHHFPYRRVGIADPGKGLPALVSEPAVGPGAKAQVIFLCSGVGFSASGLGRTPYDQFTAFRKAFDDCQDHCRQRWSVDIDYVRSGGEAADTVAVHAGIFAMQYATARFYQSLGIAPAAVVGHSLGECIALAISRALPWRDALDFVCGRARALGTAPTGRMIALPMAPKAAQPYCVADAYVAAMNGPEFTVIAGTDAAIAQVRAKLARDGHRAWPLPGDRAMHTPLMQAACPEVAALFPSDKVVEPAVRMVVCDGNNRGDLADPTRWARHLCEPVFWADAVARCVGSDPAILIEIGPGGALAGMSEEALRRDRQGLLALQSHPIGAPDAPPIGPLPVLASLWEQGMDLPWRDLWDDIGVVASARNLPGYAFAPTRYWMDMDPRDEPVASAAKVPTRDTAAKGDLRDILHRTWTTVTGLAKIDGDAEFHDIGGTSFLALQMCTALWREHQIELRVATLLRLGTLNKIRAHLERQRPEDRAPQDLEAVVAGLFDLDDDNALLDAGAMRLVIPDIVAAVRRHADQPVYPNEIERCATLGELKALIAGMTQPLDHVATARQMETAAEQPLELSIVFLLSAPRSGSTLLRVMLAGHPALFSPPEMHLMPYRTMQERALDNPASDRDQGLIKAFADLSGDASAAADLVGRMTVENWLTLDVYRALQEASFPRVLVDKSPGNTARLETLERIAKYCPQAQVIVLHRHPYAVMSSLIQNRFAALMGAEGLDPQEFAEHVWTRSVGNILDAAPFFRSMCEIRFERLVRASESVMREICAFLGIAFDAAMLTPYDGNRMRDGLGDPNFLTHKSIDPALGESWQRTLPKHRLGFAARELAGQLGYDVQLRDMPRALSIPPRKGRSVTGPKISLLEFNDSDRPPLVFLPAFDGTAECYRGLARKLDDYAAYGAQIDAPPEAGVAELVQGFAEVIAQRFPSGAVHLAGWSFGGVLALETARLLKETTGRTVQLTVLDTPARRKTRDLTDMEALKQLIAFAGRAKLDDAPLPGKTLQEALIWARDKGLLPDALFLSDVMKRVQIIRTFMPFAAQTKKYDGSVCVLRATEQPTPGPDDLGWAQAVTGRVHVGQVPILHDKMLDAENTDRVQDALRRLWREAGLS